MNFHAESSYAVWREQCRNVERLQEEQGPPDEKLLQTIWQHQRLKRDQLRTVDGRSIKVFHPGFMSNEGGPDFRRAVLQIGAEGPLSGDVEIDLQPSGWRAHGHDKNVKFQGVILRVIWNPSHKVSAALPVLALCDLLDAPLAELALTLENKTDLPESLRGKCAAPLREVANNQLGELLHAAAEVRFRIKAEAMLARARNAGWEAALWEGLFRAIGYKQNVWPMQNLAESKTRWMVGTHSAFEIQARLFGVGGLLPEDLTRSKKFSDNFLRRAWDFWWRDRDSFADCSLPRATWNFHGLRPANHPQRRLALVAHWLADKHLVEKIEDWAVAPLDGQQKRSNMSRATLSARRPAGKLVDSLLEIFQVGRDDFWSWHWTLRSPRLTKAQPLLGTSRMTDMAVNVVLPWLWIRAREGGNGELLQRIEQRFFAWPAADDNSTLKLARQRLLGTKATHAFRLASFQQGLIQIVSDFCNKSDAICSNCRFPELVVALKSQTTF